MANRTTPAKVIALLKGDYDAVVKPDLAELIRRANVMVSTAAAQSTTNFGISYSTDQKELMEEALAAYYYTGSDPLYTSRSTGGASGSFLRDKETANPYRAMAEQLDTSGALRALLKGNAASGFWLGKAESDQTSDRS